MSAKNDVEKTNKLGNLAIIFAFAFPLVGLILGIIAVATAGEDATLRVDGIKAIVMSVVVALLEVVLVITILAIAGALPFIMAGMA